MAVKCNIVGLVLDKLYKLQYGLDCKDSTNSIIRNYIESLNCIDLVQCEDVEPCGSLGIIFECQFTVKKILIVSQTINTITYGVEVIGGKAPYTYNWTFDIADFDNSGTINTNQSTLTVKVGKKLDLLVSPVSVTITDAEGCTDTKACTLTPGGLKCNDNYQACPNGSNLQIINKVTYCAKAHNLIVSNT